MLRKLFLGLVMFALTSCAMMSGNSVTLPTPIPTFAPVIATTPDPKVTQAPALGGKQSGDLFVWLYSNPNPPIQGANIFEVLVTDANGQPITDANISFNIDMTNMSHGKNVVKATSMGDGHYIGNVSFLMPGSWRVITGIERQGQTSSVRFDFNVNFK